MLPMVNGALLHQLTVRTVSHEHGMGQSIKAVLQMRSPLPRLNLGCVNLTIKANHTSATVGFWPPCTLTYTQKSQLQRQRETLITWCLLSTFSVPELKGGKQALPISC